MNPPGLSLKEQLSSVSPLGKGFTTLIPLKWSELTSSRLSELKCLSTGDLSLFLTEDLCSPILVFSRVQSSPT